jgi:uncharacterized protein
MTGELRGRTALVTGASSGIGEEFARQLATLGCDVILTARREERLAELKAEIDAAGGGTATVVAMDLAEADAPQRLFARLASDGRTVDVLVNSAGVGAYGQFLSLPWERFDELLRINVVALTHLTRLFAPAMVERGYGHVVLVSSNGAFQPTPTYAVYSASKSYVLSFGEALHYELRGTGVGCTVLAPGITATEFLKVSGQKATAYQRGAMMTSPEVVRAGVQAMLRNRPSVVPGARNAFFAWATRFVPRQLAARFANVAMRQP